MEIQSNNLHFKPINTRILETTNFISIYLDQHSKPILGKIILITGTFLTLPIAAIETIALVSIGIIGITLNALTQWKCDGLQKYTLKSFSYSLHSFMTIIFCIFNIYSCKNKGHHTGAAILNHYLYLRSAALVQNSIGKYMCKKTQGVLEADKTIRARVANLLREDLEGLMTDLTFALSRDFNISLEELPVEERIHQRAPDFFDRFPVLLDQFVACFPDDGSISNDIDFIGRLARAILMDIAQQDDAIIEDGAYHLTHRYNEEIRYQDHLKEKVKLAFAELSHDEALRAKLNDLDAEFVEPFCHFIQLKELEDRLLCPQAFRSEDLAQYNDRARKLNEVRVLLEALNREEKEALIQKLLKGNDFDLQRQSLQPLFLLIGELSVPLHQGKLMSRAIINLQNMEPEYENLLTQAWQQAINEASNAIAI